MLHQLGADESLPRVAQERLWRRDFCDGAKLRQADLESGATHSGLLCATLWCNLNTYSARRGSK